MTVPWRYLHSGYDTRGRGRNPTWAPTSKRGTFGVLVKPDEIEWERDEGYPDNNAGRVRAAVDFLDMHPSETCVVHVTGDSLDYATQVVHKVLSKDGLAGRFAAHDRGNGYVTLNRKETP